MSGRGSEVDTDLVKAQVYLKGNPLEGDHDEISGCPICGDTLRILQVAHIASRGQAAGPDAVQVVDTDGNSWLAVRVYLVCESCGFPEPDVEEPVVHATAGVTG